MSATVINRGDFWEEARRAAAEAQCLAENEFFFPEAESRSGAAFFSSNVVTDDNDLLLPSADGHLFEQEDWELPRSFWQYWTILKNLRIARLVISDEKKKKERR